MLPAELVSRTRSALPQVFGWNITIMTSSFYTLQISSIKHDYSKKSVSFKKKKPQILRELMFRYTLAPSCNQIKMRLSSLYKEKRFEWFCLESKQLENWKPALEQLSVFIARKHSTVFKVFRLYLRLNTIKLLFSFAFFKMNQLVKLF